MTDMAKETRASAGRDLHPGPAGDRRAPGLQGRHAQVADPHRARASRSRRVYIPDVGRAGALCVSSQVGCTLNCTFCHTGTQALVRNLTAAEIVAQVQVARDDLGEWPSPKEDRAALQHRLHGHGRAALQSGQRRRRPSTSSPTTRASPSRAGGSPSRPPASCPKLQALGERTQAMLAISLHATNDELRDELVPLNKKYPIAELMAGDPRLSGPLQRQAGDLRIRHAEGRQRQPGRGQGPGQAAEGHPGQDQPDPVQPLAGQPTTSAPTGGPSRPSPRSSTAPATPRRSARRAAATSSPPAAS